MYLEVGLHFHYRIDTLVSIVEVQKEEKVVFRCFLSFMMWKCNIGYNFWYVLMVYCVTYFHEGRISHRFLGSFPRERFHPGIPDKKEKKNEFSGWRACRRSSLLNHFLAANLKWTAFQSRQKGFFFPSSKTCFLKWDLESLLRDNEGYLSHPTELQWGLIRFCWFG